MNEELELDVDLLNATRLFWWDMMRSEPKNELVGDHLSPYCRIQEDFGDTARGLIGRDGCLTKLQNIKSNILLSGLDSKMHHLKVMPDGSETRFILYGRVPISKTIDRDVSLGVAIEWHGGVVTCMTVVRNVNIEQFMDGEINHERASMCSVRLSLQSRDSSHVQSPAKRNDSRDDGSTHFMGFSLKPPYKVSKPLAVPPTVSVVVLGCENLKSRLIRFISRPINTRVTVRVGQIVQSTQIVRDSANPVYGGRDDEPFVFQIPKAHLTNGYMEFIVDDVHLDAVPLAIARIPFAAFPLKEDTLIPHDIYVPLDLLPSYIFRQPPDIRISRVSKFGIYEEADSTYIRDNSQKLPVLKVIIAKVDILQWWAMRELQARDSERDSSLAGLEKLSHCGLREAASTRSEHALVGEIATPERERVGDVADGDGEGDHAEESEARKGVAVRAECKDEEGDGDDDDPKRRSVRWITSADMW
jgi:hypothetical protein